MVTAERRFFNMAPRASILNSHLQWTNHAYTTFLLSLMSRNAIIRQYLDAYCFGIIYNDRYHISANKPSFLITADVWFYHLYDNILEYIWAELSSKLCQQVVFALYNLVPVAIIVGRVEMGCSSVCLGIYTCLCMIHRYHNKLLQPQPHLMKEQTYTPKHHVIHNTVPPGFRGKYLRIPLQIHANSAPHFSIFCKPVCG